MRSNRCIVLELLAVHPGFQRRGAGMALVKWGADAADKDGVDVSTNHSLIESLLQFGTSSMFDQ